MEVEDESGSTSRPKSRRGPWIAAGVTAAIVAAGIGIGVAAAGPVPANARIPHAAAKDAAFAEDNDGAGSDQQQNILRLSAPGVVTIRSGGAETGAGIVITRSGYVLAAYRSAHRAGPLAARLVMSGRTYAARVVGSDSDANLALLQLSGGPFKPVAIGTASGLRPQDRVASAGGSPAARGLTMSTGKLIRTGVPVTLDGRRLTGLLETTSLTAPASELGGPVFNLSGQVVGLNVGSGTHVDVGYAVPVDSALRIARKIAGQ
ncbi:MAG: serine protease [Streptosporangiales bacterium]|nr:serine protease [Streptosporangiales bacterium]